MTTHAERVKLTAERFAALKRELHEAGTDRSEAIREALAAGMTHREVAKHTGLSRQRVTQLGDPNPTRGSHYRAT